MPHRLGVKREDSDERRLLAVVPDDVPRDGTAGGVPHGPLPQGEKAGARTWAGLVTSW